MGSGFETYRHRKALFPIFLNSPNSRASLNAGTVYEPCEVLQPGGINAILFREAIQVPARLCGLPLVQKFAECCGVETVVYGQRRRSFRLGLGTGFEQAARLGGGLLQTITTRAHRVNDALSPDGRSSCGDRREQGLVD